MWEYTLNSDTTAEVRYFVLKFLVNHIKDIELIQKLSTFFEGIEGEAKARKISMSLTSGYLTLTVHTDDSHFHKEYNLEE